MEEYQKQTEKIKEKLNAIGSKVAVMSGKGGVGKSVVTSLISSSLSRNGGKVGILDADITGPSIPKIFGVHERPMMSEAGIIPPTSSSGIGIMSINLLLEAEGQPVIWRGPLISGTIRQFMSDVDWSGYEWLMVDLPPGTSDATLTVMQSIPLDGIVIVTTPQDLVGMIVEKSLNMAKSMNIPVLGIVENMSGMICPHCGERSDPFGKSKVEELAAKYDVRLLGRIPIDPSISRLCDDGNMESQEFPAVEEIVSTMRKAIDEGRK